MTKISLKTPQGKLVLAATVIASGISFLFGTAITVALPTIQEFFNASFSSTQWVINSFTLTLGALILISGSFSDIYGRKRIFIYGMFVFGFGGLLSGFSSSIEMLIAFQVVQGTGAAMMIPGSLAIINVLFPKEERGQAIGLWSGLSAGIGASGPFLGGVLVEVFSWRGVFFFTIPLLFIAYFITKKYVVETKGQAVEKIDYGGVITILIALLGIIYGITRGSVSGWGDEVVLGSLVIGFISFILFIIIERRVKNSIVPLEIFKIPSVVGANIITLILYFALFGLIFFLTFNLVQVQGYSPTLTGLATIPPILIIALFSGWSGKMSDKYGIRLPMIIGPMFVGFGMLLIGFSGVEINYRTDLLPGQILFGFGMALVVPSVTRAALHVPDEFSGAASGVNNAISRIGFLFAIAILSAVMLSFFTNNFSAELQNKPYSKEIKQELLSQVDKLAAITIPESASVSEQQEIKALINESFIYGFERSMMITAFLAFLSSLIAAATLPRRMKKL